MNKTSEYFLSINEPFASGFFEDPDRSKFYRFSKAFGRFFETLPLMPYNGGNLYPTGKMTGFDSAVVPHFSHTYWFFPERLSEKSSEEYVKLIKRELAVVDFPPMPHDVGGYAYVHSFPNYHRIEVEGLDSYRERIQKIEDADFRDGLLFMLDSIEGYLGRILEMLRKNNAPEKLICALEKVPFKPAETLYEAVVCRNFIYYLDLCDDPGRLDAELAEFYNGEDITALLSEFFDNVDMNDGWSVAIGPDYNELTLQILKASKGKRRPSIELRTSEDMPEEIWQAAIEGVKAGGGSPAFYNEKLYQQKLAEKFPHIPKEDLMKFNGGGCTETMLAGISRVGSLDAGINTALILRNVITDHLTDAESFDDFYKKLLEIITLETEGTIDKVNYIYNQRIKDVPQPMRTLLIDDCIDNATDFNAGGARYNWSVINFAGIINVIDSLLAIRELVFEKKRYSAEKFINLLDAEDEEFYATLKTCECFGVDNPSADALAADFSEKLFGILDNFKPVFGECFLPSSIQFATYTYAGEPVGATPDGRKSGAPLCDSLAPIHGKDVKGPTALLGSVTKLALSKALGTPVLNISLSPEHIDKALKPLIQGYFEKDGMQMQITCVSKADMLDALEHPERHQNLIVRVGGYAEYFNRLSDEMKKSVIERTVQI